MREVRALRGPYGFTPGERWLPEMGGYRKSGEVYIVEKGGENRSHSWRVLSERNPRSLMCDNIVSDDEAAALIALAAPSLKRSRVVSHGSGKVDPGRTSEGVFLENSDPVVKAVRNRVSQLAMVSERLMERTQVLKYTEGQYYKLHPDYFVGSKRERLGALGQRVATVMVWLNHVKSGGETQFNTRPKSTVLPSRNSAILFYSVDKEGVEDSSSVCVFFLG